MPEALGPQPAEYDAAWVRAKYQVERAKRLRAEAVDQYVEVTADFSHYAEDPYTERTDRDPVCDHVQVLIIGGGRGSLIAAARLQEAGVDDIRIVDTAGDFGGTWYWNRYPGAQCDIESYIYLPLLEELGYLPTERYAHAPEIRDHLQSVARHYGLYRNALLQTTVTGMRWNEGATCWEISTDRGDEFTAALVAVSPGSLTRPKLPGITGINEFAGHTFHTSRWDYDYTGGDESGGLTTLTDKRVGIIGTGATGLQCIPHLQPSHRGHRDGPRPHRRRLDAQRPGTHRARGGPGERPPRPGDDGRRGFGIPVPGRLRGNGATAGARQPDGP